MSGGFLYGCAMILVSGAAVVAVVSRSSSRWDYHFHSYVLTIYVRLY